MNASLQAELPTNREAPHYFAADSPDGMERERLRLLTQMVDPITRRRLTFLGVGPGWHCLEVGAGDGSVARWLAAQVGTQGTVTATDLNPRFLIAHGLPNLEVRQHDILVDDLERGHYDLVHCRAVLMHLPDPLRCVKQLAAAVRPGGWLFLEEFDFGSFGALDPEHPRAAAFNRRMRTIFNALEAMRIIDVSFGRRLTNILTRLAFVEIGQDCAMPVSQEPGADVRFAKMWIDLLRPHLVGAGVLSDADFDELHNAYQDSSFAIVGRTLFGAWGRRLGF
jgi:SAM-dependent methyltransferase